MELARLLRKEFDKRKKKNRSYSLRSYAASLKMDPTSLLRIMNGKRLPTSSTVRKILSALDRYDLLTPIEKDLSALKKSKSLPLKDQAFDPQVFEALFDTAHVLTLASLRMHNISVAKLKKVLLPKLRLSESDLEKVLDDLQKAGAIKRFRSEIEVIYKNKSTVPLPFTTQKRREIQKQFLAMAASAIDTVPLSERDNATLSLPIHKDDIEKAKEILQEARNKINQLSEKRKKNDLLYNVCTALYPVVS